MGRRLLLRLASNLVSVPGVTSALALVGWCLGHTTIAACVFLAEGPKGKGNAQALRTEGTSVSFQFKKSPTPRQNIFMRHWSSA